MSNETMTKVAKHGEHAGREDYEGRAADVAAGEPASWAWPFAGADDAYLSAVGTGAGCHAIGLPESAWDEISAEWLAAFKRGYEAEHAESQS